MTGYSDDKMLDDESASTVSFVNVPNGQTTLPVGGVNEPKTSPDVLYVLQYIGDLNRVLDTRRSSEPFASIPEHHADAGEDAASSNQTGKPVLEIITKVFLGADKKRRRHRHRAPHSVPPVGYDHFTYQFDDYDSDESDFLVQDETVSRVEKTYMVIHSEHLINALKAIIAYYPNVNLTGKSVTIEAPYRVLVHHREQLAHYKTAHPAHHDAEYVQTTDKHLEIMLGFLDAATGEQLLAERARHAQKRPTATFDFFWMLLRPGEIMYAKKNDIWSPFVISSVSQSLARDANRPPPYRVSGWFLEFIGNKVGRFMTSFYQHPWTGEQAIASLDVIPAAFFQDAAVMAAKQIELGRLYWSLLQRPAYMEYDGQIVSRDGVSAMPRGPSGYMTGRVICDAEGYARFYGQSPDWNSRATRLVPPERSGGPSAPPKDHIPHYQPRCRCAACIAHPPDEEADLFVGFEDLDPKKDTPPESDIFWTALTNIIPAFILGERRWGFLNLEHLRPVKTDGEAFKYLVLDDEVKTAVKALVGKFAADGTGRVTPWTTDFVKNKGEGCIFLLHGEPGTGKTLTAETTAELTNRPLISLTSGDLSVSSYTVEANLNYFLQLGQRWGAIVLLDEADVYLERRRAKDISRNGLVSVFLRALEYYRGVLLLTTNRVQAFDAAFTSRIHVALHYRNLTDTDRERIWANNFDRLDRDSKGKVHVAVSAREHAYQSREVRSLRWNGREIRNAMQTAVTLAESEAAEEGSETITVTDRHLRRVVKMSRGFKDFMRKTRQRRDDDSDDDEDDGPAREDDDRSDCSEYSL